jgi:hypothetical protein
MELDPTASVRSTCEWVHSQSEHVSLNEAAIELFAESIKKDTTAELMDGVEWDACGWHYDADAEARGPLTCQYVFVMDALNFCFWPSPGLEYVNLLLSTFALFLSVMSCCEPNDGGRGCCAL